MEQPELADVRDACADLMRGGKRLEGYDDKQESDKEESEMEGQASQRLVPLRKSRGSLPETRSSKAERRLHKNGVLDREDFPRDPGLEAIDIGVIDDEGIFKRKKMCVKIRGRCICNYPSERAMTRGGWLRFRIIAKDSNLYDAVRLYRTWKSFLN